jgi:hypothetical protein
MIMYEFIREVLGERAYWLDPAQRRYFPQDMATDYIGFRCAMSRVGPKSDGRKTPRNFYKITIKALSLGLFFNRFRWI